MAYRVTSVFTRPSTSVSWYKTYCNDACKTPDAEVQGLGCSGTCELPVSRADLVAAFQEFNKDRPTETESADGLTLTFVTDFVSESEYESFLTNNTIKQFRTDRHLWNLENNITLEITTTNT